MADKKMFFRDNYYFYGHQCDMISALTKTIDESSRSSLFSSAIELFITAALVGAYYDSKEKVDPDHTKKTNILAEQFNKHAVEVRRAFKFVLLVGDRTKLDAVTRLNRTFRNPETDENYNDFEEHMLGGLKDIYDSLILRTNTKYQDYLNSACNFLNNFSDDEIETPTLPISNDDFF